MPKSSWQQSQGHEQHRRQQEIPKGSWEKAREEIRRREEERKAKEAEQRRKEEAARRLRELREREAREREQREKEARERGARENELRERKEREIREQREKEQREKERLEREIREKLERETREKVERELREKAEREAKERETKEREERVRREAREREAKEREDQRRKEEEEKNFRKGSTYAYSSVGERTSMWPNGKPPATSPQPAAAKAASPSPLSPKKPAAPTAKSNLGTDQESSYSYRPYDKPRKPVHKKSVSDFSESSWAPSQSTARTTPPPSERPPYTTKDPDKIVIKAVYGFVNQFAKTPASQLISGVGSVTDGLILRITTEGLFIDDDVRGVAQREWDVKAWTLKLVEVWCPSHVLASANAAQKTPGAQPINHPFFGTMPSASHRGAPKPLTGDAADAYLVEVLSACKDTCRLGLSSASASASASSAASFVSGSAASKSNDIDKTGEWTSKGLHLLRATVRDQEGKRFLFVLSEGESWKVAVGLQRLRRGTQVRALGVSSFSAVEAKSLLETLGWS
jgi:hypothetical protein